MLNRRIRRASAAGAVKDQGPLRGVLRTSLTAVLTPANLHLGEAEAPPFKKGTLYTLILPFSCPKDGEHLSQALTEHLCHSQDEVPNMESVISVRHR